MGKVTTINCALVILVCAVYAPVRNYDFVKYDDPDYVENNRFVQQGLTGESVRWAFTEGTAANWHPLTWLSHMLDIELFGKWAGGHHLTSVLIHAVNSVLLMLVLWRMTGAVWRSAFVAALFALHPLAVESVAWISQRKSVLSTMFWLLVMLAYASYADKRTAGRYALVFVLLALGLMCKPMLVTLPFVLLLLDFWPLGRDRREPLKRLVLEKAPLLILAIVSAVITLTMQSHVAVHHGGEWTFGLRASNAAVAYVRYLGNMCWPTDLMMFYPFPPVHGWWPTWLIVASLVSIALFTGWALKLARRRRVRYVIVGWLWFLGTLVPVNGLIVQQASQSMADRFTYVPLIGVFVALVWGATDLVQRRRALGVAGVVVLLALIGTTCRQLPVWRDTLSLYGHAAKTDPNNWVANFGLGVYHHRRRDLVNCSEYMSRVLRVQIFGRHGRKFTRDAIATMAQSAAGMGALHRDTIRRPDDARAHVHFATALIMRGQTAPALTHVQKALTLDPANAQAHVMHGRLHAAAGRADQTVAAYRTALKSDPFNPDAHFGLALALKMSGQLAASRYHAQKVAEYDPRLAAPLEAQLQAISSPSSVQ